MQVNPIIQKDFKLKMRNTRTAALIAIYLGSLGMIAFLFCISGSINPDNNFTFGPKNILDAFVAISIFQYLMVIIITALLAADSIIGEKDRQTIDLIFCTDFSPLSFFLGKLTVSIIHVLLLIISSLPIMAIVFLFKGVGISIFFLFYFFYICTSVLIASISIYFSMIVDSLKNSCILTYVTGAVLIAAANIFVTKLFLLPTGSYHSVYQLLGDTPWLMFVNPFYGFGSIIDSNSIPFFESMIHYNNEIFPTLFGIQIKPWMANATFYLFASATFLYLAARRVKR